MVLPSLCLYLVLLLIICEVCKGFYSGAWGQLSSDRAIPRLNSIYKQRQSRNILAAAKEVTAEELELEFQDWETPMLLDVFATWCGPCQLLMPELDRLDTMLGEGKMRILKLDSEKYPQIAGAFRVRGLPTLLFMKDGQLTGRIEGALPAEELVKLVDHLCFGGPAPDLEGDIRELVKVHGPPMPIWSSFFLKMRILKLDSEKYPQIAGAFRVRGLPTLLFMKDGQLTGRIEGALPAEELVKLVDHLCFDGPAPDLEGDIREVDE